LTKSRDEAQAFKLTIRRPTEEMSDNINAGYPQAEINEDQTSSILYLPEYSTREMLHKKLLLAITNYGSA